MALALTSSFNINLSWITADLLAVECVVILHGETADLQGDPLWLQGDPPWL